MNNNGFSNIGIGRGMPETTGIAAGRENVDVSQTSRDTSLRVSSSSIGVQSVGPASAEPVFEVPESELSRDDGIGNLMKAVFSLPPPPMPSFAT